MKSLREYLDIITQLDERVTIGADGKVTGGLKPQPAPTATAGTPPPPAAASASPWANDPAKDAAWKALSPEDQKWLGGADPTDKFILARAPKKGAPAAAPAAAAPAPAAAQPPKATGAILDPNGPSNSKESEMMAAADQADADMGAAMTANAAAAAPPAMTAADQDDADMGKAMAANAQAANGVNTAGQNVTMPNGINPETGTPTTVASAAPPAPAGQGASPAAPANRDAMPFGKAFADAKAKGESQFTWKGKPYAVQLAKPDPANKTAEVAKRTGVAMNSTAGAGRGNMVPPAAPVKESAPSYDEVQRLIGLVHYR